MRCGMQSLGRCEGLGAEWKLERTARERTGRERCGEGRVRGATCTRQKGETGSKVGDEKATRKGNEKETERKWGTGAEGNAPYARVREWIGAAWSILYSEPPAPLDTRLN